MPSYDVLAILHSVRLLLIDPNPLSPANLEAALLYRNNRIEYERRVAQVIQETFDDTDEEVGHIEDADTLREKTTTTTTILRESISQ